MENVFYKLITGSNKYAKLERVNENKLLESNQKLAHTLEMNGVNKLILTSLGNSIATGFSYNSNIKPLFLRNPSLYYSLMNNYIKLDLYSFARAQDNNDEHVLEWITSNIKQSEINKMVHMDFGSEETSMLKEGMNSKLLDKYYPLKPYHDIGLQDLIKQNNEGSANIIVYNGLTGSFLDNITRKGKHYNLYGFKRDLVSLEAVLKTIYLTNSNTQVYVCGIPNLLHLNVTEIVNKNLKRMCKLYPNTTYVPGAPARLIYGKDGKIIPDMHYSLSEYLHMNNNIISSINDNYVKNKLFIEFDQVLKHYSNLGQFLDHDIRRNEDLMIDIIDRLLDKYKGVVDKKTAKELISYYKERYPHDFYYTKKDTIIDELIEGKRR